MTPELIMAAGFADELEKLAAYRPGAQIFEEGLQGVATAGKRNLPLKDRLLMRLRLSPTARAAAKKFPMDPRLLGVSSTAPSQRGPEGSKKLIKDMLRRRRLMRELKKDL
jgi:hypothetical protein